MSAPLVTVILATYNQQPYVAKALKSILEQTYNNIEIIICDNSSNELTQQAIAEFSDERIVNLRTGNLKMTDNWNHGIHAISGQYLILMSDKGVLKQGSLDYLNNLIQAENHDCVTWCLDPFIEPDSLIQLKPSEHSIKINSNDLITFWDYIDSIVLVCPEMLRCKRIGCRATRLAIRLARFAAQTKRPNKK